MKKLAMGLIVIIILSVLTGCSEYNLRGGSDPLTGGDIYYRSSESQYKDYQDQQWEQWKNEAYVDKLKSEGAILVDKPGDPTGTLTMDLIDVRPVGAEVPLTKIRSLVEQSGADPQYCLKYPCGEGQGPVVVAARYLRNEALEYLLELAPGRAQYALNAGIKYAPENNPAYFQSKIERMVMACIKAGATVEPDQMAQLEAKEYLSVRGFLKQNGIIVHPLLFIDVKSEKPAAGREGEPYYALLKAGGGDGHGYQWNVGRLPEGVKLMSNTGEIVGTPTKAGRFWTRAEVRSHDGQVKSAQILLSIVPSGQSKSYYDDLDAEKSASLLKALGQIKSPRIGAGVYDIPKTITIVDGRLTEETSKDLAEYFHSNLYIYDKFYESLYPALLEAFPDPHKLMSKLEFKEKFPRIFPMAALMKWLNIGAGGSPEVLKNSQAKQHNTQTSSRKGVSTSPSVPLHPSANKPDTTDRAESISNASHFKGKVVSENISPQIDLDEKHHKQPDLKTSTTKKGDISSSTRLDERVAPVKIGGKWGYVDRGGKFVITPQFASAVKFSEGLAAVKTGGKWGFIDQSGQFVIAPRFAIAYSFSDGLSAVEIDGKWGFIDQSGQFVIELQFDGARSFREGAASVKKYGNWGFIDRTGNMFIEAQFKDAIDFKEGLAAVKKDKTWGYINKSGDYVIAPQFDFCWNFSEGKAPVISDWKWGFIDSRDQFVITPQFESAGDFRESLAQVKQGGRWGYVDPAGKFVIKPQFDDTGDFSSGLARVKSGSKWGYINQAGQFVIEPRFDDAGDF